MGILTSTNKRSLKPQINALQRQNAFLNQQLASQSMTHIHHLQKVSQRDQHSETLLKTGKLGNVRTKQPTTNHHTQSGMVGFLHSPGSRHTQQIPSRCSSFSSTKILSDQTSHCLFSRSTISIPTSRSLLLQAKRESLSTLPKLPKINGRTSANNISLHPESQPQCAMAMSISTLQMTPKPTGRRRPTLPFTASLG